MLDSTHFDGLYRDSADPWGFGSRWYERRKRDVLLAALPRPLYTEAFEAGCANGELAAALAPRCERLLACDFHDLALQHARQRLGAYPQVDVQRLRLPDQWPPRRFDLIVISELGYYLDPADLLALGRLARNALAGAQAAIVACHWRHPVPEARADGDEVHRLLAQVLDLPRVLRHEERDFLLEIWTADGRSVAQAEGLA